MAREGKCCTVTYDARSRGIAREGKCCRPSIMNNIICYRATFPPLWQSLVNEHHMLPCNISPLWQSLVNEHHNIVTVQHFPSLAIPHEQHHMLPCNISPLWQSLVNEHHMLPCNISPLWQSLVNSIIWYCATFPLSGNQSLMNSIICYRAHISPLL